MKQKTNSHILLIHTASTDDNLHAPAVMSMGLLALADFLTTQGHPTQVLNLPLMTLQNTAFDLFNYIKQHEIKIIGLSLQWHWQLYPTISLAKAIKQRNADIHIVLGGFTASFFHREILKKFGWIDFVIRGDAEIPFYRLAATIFSDQKRLPAVPNLTWRREHNTIVNPHTYSVTKKIIDRLNYFNTSLLINDPDLFLRRSSEHYAHLGKILYYNIGRGCSTNCSCCGGSSIAQELLYKRKVIIKSTGAIIRNLWAADQLQPDYIHTSFDPCPRSDLFVPLLKKIAREKFTFSFIFTSWNLPSARFLSVLTGSFQNPVLILSPDTWSEELRALNKGFSYSNRDLIKTLTLCKKRKIAVKCFFATGFPFETREDFQKTLRGVEFLQQNFDINLISNLLSLDPASPMFLNPRKYHIKLKKKTLEDFLAASARKNQDTHCGYETDCFSEDEIIHNYKILSRLCDGYPPAATTSLEKKPC